LSREERDRGEPDHEMIAESIRQIPLILGPKRSMTVLAEDSDRSEDRRAARVAAPAGE
jgi:hypothetical protein